MGRNVMILSQVFASAHAWFVDGEKLGIWVVRWGVRELQGGTRLGLRAVGLENRPTCAAHLDIGRRCKPLFGRYTIGVGASGCIPGRPPLRTVRAVLPHTALRSVVAPVGLDEAHMKLI